MARKGNIPSFDGAQHDSEIPTYAFWEARAHQAWDAYKAVLDMERCRPDLLSNPYWTMHRDDAYAEFSKAFARLA